MERSQFLGSQKQRNVLLWRLMGFISEFKKDVPIRIVDLLGMFYRYSHSGRFWYQFISDILLPNLLVHDLLQKILT